MPISGAPGSVVAGKYQVLSTLGRGGMGKVLEVRRVDFGGRFALKTLEGEDAVRVQRLQREARAAAKLRGPHVVRVVDVGADEGTPFLVMELVEGETLAGLLARGRLSVARAAAIALDVCEALSEAHAQAVVHRDVKPSNVLLAERPGDVPFVKVTDFGIAKTVSSATTEVLALTQASSLLGSPSYMSPQQIRDPSGVDGRTDLWSVGVLLFEMLTGRVPFTAYTTPALLAAIAGDAPEAPSSLAPEVPPALDRIVLRCLEKDPTRRYQTAAELAADLGPFGEDPKAAARVAALASPRAAPLRVASQPVAGGEKTADATTVTQGDDPAGITTQRQAGSGRVTAVAVAAVLVGAAVGTVGVLVAKRGGSAAAPVASTTATSTVPVTSSVSTTAVPAPPSAPSVVAEPTKSVTPAPSAEASASVAKAKGAPKGGAATGATTATTTAPPAVAPPQPPTGDVPGVGKFGGRFLGRSAGPPFTAPERARICNHPPIRRPVRAHVVPRRSRTAAAPRRKRCRFPPNQGPLSTQDFPASMSSMRTCRLVLCALPWTMGCSAYEDSGRAEPDAFDPTPGQQGSSFDVDHCGSDARACPSSSACIDGACVQATLLKDTSDATTLNVTDQLLLLDLGAGTWRWRSLVDEGCAGTFKAQLLAAAGQRVVVDAGKGLEVRDLCAGTTFPLSAPAMPERVAACSSLFLFVAKGAVWSSELGKSAVPVPGLSGAVDVWCGPQAFALLETGEVHRWVGAGAPVRLGTAPTPATRLFGSGKRPHVAANPLSTLVASGPLETQWTFAPRSLVYGGATTGRTTVLHSAQGDAVLREGQDGKVVPHLRCTAGPPIASAVNASHLFALCKEGVLRVPAFDLADATD